jgi:phage tail sheath gpL-like
MDMSINSQSNVETNLSIGPTSLGMVRIYIEGKNINIPLDFDPEEALEIAEELKAAALIAQDMDKKKK